MADRLEALAERVERLTIQRIDPEAFHAERSDLGRQIRREIGRLRIGVHPRPSTTWRP